MSGDDPDATIKILENTGGPPMTQPEDDAARLHPHPHGAKPMSSEQVSDMRLEALRGLNAMRSEMVSHTDHDRKAFSDVAIALAELKSRRAQHEPPAGCAEMAREIVNTLMPERPATAASDLVTFDRSGFVVVIAAKLAPLFGLIELRVNTNQLGERLFVFFHLWERNRPVGDF